MDKIDQVADIISASKKVVIFTGAGISTESGFRISEVRGEYGRSTTRAS
jgi:NAD-dependent SIR2 family protein deacetylase